MGAAKCTDAEFIELWNTHKSPTKISKLINVSLSMVNGRRRRIEKRHGIQLQAADSRTARYQHLQTAHLHKSRLSLGIENGTVIVFSDAHFWPGIRTTAFKGLLWAIQTFKPKAIINNGDAFDGAAISRHPRIGWDSKPSVIEELKACEMALGEIEDIAGRAKLVWTMGNHDSRFESRLSANAPEFEGVRGFSLASHFPKWHSCWACWPTAAWEVPWAASH